MKRKSWQPEYRFGGNPASWELPNRLGENQIYVRSKKKARKKS